MGPNDWTALGLVITVVVVWLGALHRRVATDTMPRREAMDKFNAIEKRMDRDIGRIEASNAEHFRRVYEKLDHIADIVSRKVDR